MKKIDWRRIDWRGIGWELMWAFTIVVLPLMIVVAWFPRG